MKKLLLCLIICFTAGCMPAQGGNNSFPKLNGPYLGQTRPGIEPVVFAPGIVSDGLINRDIAMMPDGKEIYFCSAAGNYNYTAIYFTKLKNGRWTKPEVLSFASDPGYMNLEPFISPDGKKLYFLSNKPSIKNGVASEDQDIWVAERKGEGWGEPVNLGPPINTDSGEFFPSVTNEGTIYFSREEKQTRANFIYRSRLVNGKYTEPEKLGPEINSGKSQYNAFIAPDESYIIVPVFGRADSRGGTDYYIVYRSKEDKWSKPINLGDKINTVFSQEWSPYVSPDGKYFFFMSIRLNPELESGKIKLTYDQLKKIHNSPQNGNPDTYWVSAGFIEALRPKGF